MADRAHYVEQFNCQRISGINEEKEVAKLGRPFSFICKTNVKTGDYFNCSKSYMDLDVSGGVAGLLSAHNMELKMPSTNPGAGMYVCAEHELVFQDAAVPNTTYFAVYNVSGTQARIDAWEDVANVLGGVFRFEGLTSGDGSIFDATSGPSAADAALAIVVNGTKYWISLSSTK